ncbi:phosphoribosyltransferase domain-containing protein, partial [Selenomonas sp. F0473]|uniref:phosphoribosyltransferase domain-containing protein n=1 Tax=Selenomonas sp. F0473 TaxID=999423 RepID=UPI0025EF8552
MKYTADAVLRVARRHRNEKRGYLLVNPLQGKHMPVAPHEALDLMGALGEKVKAAAPAARLVIGFAETATAIGAVVAKSLADSCLYVQTTREELPSDVRTIEFLEEHSHAPEQRLAVDALEAQLAETDTVVFVDDEISTGRTLCNIVEQMKEKLPALGEKRLVAASVLNRLT